MVIWINSNNHGRPLKKIQGGAKLLIDQIRVNFLLPQKSLIAKCWPLIQGCSQEFARGETRL